MIPPERGVPAPSPPAAEEPAPADLAPAARAAARSDSPRTAALAEVLLCSGFPTQLTLAAALAAAGVAATGAAGDLSLTYVVALSIGDTLLLFGLIAFFLRRRGEQPAEVFLGARPHLPEAVLGAAAVPLALAAAWAGLRTIHAFWPWLRNVAENPMEALIRSPLDAAVFAVVAIVAGAVREEVQRAFILRRFEQHLGGGWLGLAVFSVVFGLGHYVQGWDASVVTALLGALWGAMFLVRRSIVASVVSHAGFNASEILIVLAGAAAGPAG